MALPRTFSRVLHVDAATGRVNIIEFGSRVEHLGGSGLAAALYAAYGDPSRPHDDPAEPIIFCIGPLTGYFPLMSKVVCGFRSPYTKQWAESHAGGRLALALRFADYDALMITGRAVNLSCLVVGSRLVELHNVDFLAGRGALSTGRQLRRFGKDAAGHRSTMRIGPAGEKGVSYACINVDSFRHFGRLGSGAVLGRKNIKGIVVLGDASLELAPNKEYPKFYKEIYGVVTGTPLLKKYHDLGTAENLVPLNAISALPWRNLTATSDPAIDKISGERFADDWLLRQTACAGCPVGCIHIGLLRQQFAAEHQFVYRQVPYDYELIYAQGSMLGLTNPEEILTLLDETEKIGLDVMSSGLALAWATEASAKGVLSTAQTIVPFEFGKLEPYLKGINYLGKQANEFYRDLGAGTLHAAQKYGGADYACVLGQEMAGYATGETFYVASAFGFRHSHLDSSGYAWDQTAKERDADKAVAFLLEDEEKRVMLTSMVSCLFARNAYPFEKVTEALNAVGLPEIAANLGAATTASTRLRWKLKFQTGFKPEEIIIPKRFMEVVNWKGQTDPVYLERLRKAYVERIRHLAGDAV